MALSVLSCASVVSAKPAPVPAPEPVPYPSGPYAILYWFYLPTHYSLPYAPGVAYVITPMYFNYANTHKADYGISTASASAHTRTPKISANANASQGYAYSDAETGVNVTLNLNGYSWASIENNPCRVNVTIKYSILAKASPGNLCIASAYASQFPADAGGGGPSVYPVGQQSNTVTLSWSGTLGRLFGYYGTTTATPILQTIAGYVYTSSNGGEAHAQATVSNITVQF